MCHSRICHLSDLLRPSCFGAISQASLLRQSTGPLLPPFRHPCKCFYLAEAGLWLAQAVLSTLKGRVGLANSRHSGSGRW